MTTHTAKKPQSQASHPMNSKIKLIAVGIVLSCASHAAWATTLNFDYLSLMPTGTTGFDAGHTATVNGITASAYYFDTTSNSWQSADLYIRNDGVNDTGLGVCSPGEVSTTPCNSPSYTSGGGDSNELSQELNQEVIVLSKTAGYSWSDLVVSSLDSGGTNGAEQGTMYWSNDSTADINTFLNNTIASSNNAAFSYGTGGAANDQIDINGSVLALNDASSFDPNAQHVVFTSGAGSQIASGMLGNGGSTTTQTCGYTWTKWGKQKTCTTTTTPALNNDFLVSGAVLNSIPEPGTLALMGLGLVGLYAGRRRAVNR